MIINSLVVYEERTDMTPCKCNTSMCAMCQEENVRTGNKVLKSGAKSTTKEGFAS